MLPLIDRDVEFTYWEYTLPLTTLGFISPGNNIIQVLAEDHGGATFFDLKLTTGDVIPFIDYDQTMEN
jgi:hypothetical protein